MVEWGVGFWHGHGGLDDDDSVWKWRCEMLVAWGIVIGRGRCCLGLVHSSAMLCTAI